MGETYTKLCECGCGEPAAIAKRTRPYLGHVKGQPTRFRFGHGPRNPNPRRGDRHPNWKGGRASAGGGYLLVKVDADHPYAEMRDKRGYVYEHRLVMAEAIGRALDPDEVVHHRNRDIADNRIENLSLFEGQSDHARFHGTACV